MRSLEELNYWDSLLSNLSHPGFIITELLLVVVVVCFYCDTDNYHNRYKYNMPIFAKYTGIAIASFVFLSGAVIAIGGGIYYSSSKEELISQNIAKKYDFELVEVTKINYESVGTYGEFRFRDSDTGLQRGYYDDNDDLIDSAKFSLDQFNEPIVEPWEGVDKVFVDSLIRSDWK